ncbi:hypothetical protein Amet_4095 [Alkaliphilus metalliredigens QYMF]|uniref:MOSC domain-containing protein n=1 Tax=Alkaliphilus metalliredigens (strain QYMF) TaxID=293826 RepID=A6TVF8_ALKMQ|nr:hypothetical protein [Alkaliphilus metalliredigens]ABR50176.1 hypothetical protein Amet_4095 [Alkaliphilus metalliredigens QYMF]
MQRIQGIYDKDQGGNWHQCESILVEVKNQEERQLSFITSKGLKELVETTGKGFCHNRFQANFIVEGLSLKVLNKVDLYEMGQAVIRITEIGKHCHPNCPLISKSRKCHIQEHIFFAKTIKTGDVQIGNSLKIQSRA